MEGKKPKWKAQFNRQRGDKPTKIKQNKLTKIELDNIKQRIEN